MVQIEVKNPKECLKCGQKIGFKQLKSGKWMPVNADYCDGKYLMTINVGNHKNSTVCHKCSKSKCVECGEEYITNNGFDGYCSKKCIKEKIKKIEEGNFNVWEDRTTGDYRSSEEYTKDTLKLLKDMLK